MILAARSWARISVLWLSLATIFAHALIPTGSPLIPANGSAFNAFTKDVSLGPSRAAVPEKEKRQREGNAGKVDLFGGYAIANWLQIELDPQFGHKSVQVGFPPNAALGPSYEPTRNFRARAPPLAER